MPLFKRKPKSEHRAVVQRHTRALAVAPTSVDTEKRTFTFVLSTESPVRICGQLPDLGFTDFDEILAADGLDQSRLTGAPIVDSHDLSTVDRIVGVIESVSRDGSQWVGTGRLSRSEKGSRVLADIADGILRQVSVGYTVQSYSVATRDGAVPLATATAWTPHEISIVAVGADANAIIRAADLISSNDSAQENNMDPELLAALQAAADKIIDAAEAVASAAPSDGSADDAIGAAVDAADAANAAVSDLGGGDDAAESNEARGARISKIRESRAQARAADDSAAGSDTEKKPEDADEQAARSMARKAGLSQLADKLFTAGASAIEVRSALLNALVARSEAVGEIVTRPATGTATSETQKRSLASDVYARMNKRA